MRIQPTITFGEYFATHRAILAAKPRSAKSDSWRYYLALAIVCLAIGIAAQFPPTRIPTLTLLAAMILFRAVGPVLGKRSREKCMRRFYAEEEPTLNDQVLTIDESGISYVRGNGQVTSHHSWSAFIYCIQMPDALIFLPTPNSFVRVPAKVLTPTDDQKIREWSSAVPRRAAN
jgi:hypothetical protein